MGSFRIKPSASRTVRATLSVVLSLSLAIAPAAQAADGTYFRFPRIIGPGAPVGQGPDIGTNNPSPNNPAPDKPGVVRGTGDLAVYSPIQIRARIGVDFALQFDATNAVNGITWANAGVALPDGLSITPGGLLKGRPTRVMSVTEAKLKATDGVGKTGTTQGFTIDVEPVPAVSVNARYDVPAGKEVLVSPVAAHVFGSSSWSVSGALPPGVSLDPGTGRMRGVPERRGTYEGLVLSVLDSDGAQGFSAPFAIVADGTMSVSGIQPSYMARTGRGMASIRPILMGAIGTATWGLSGASGPLPPGLDVDPLTGTVAGTPSLKGDFPGIALRAEDSSTGERSASIPFLVRIGGMPAISVGEGYSGRAGSAFSVSPQATDVLGGGAWSYDGALPAGLTVDPALGTVKGLIGAPGTSSGIVLRVTDLFDGAIGESAPFSIRAWPALKVTSPEAPPAALGVSYALPAPAVSGLRGTASWSISGSLPPGLSFDKAEATLSGTPTAAGTYGLTYEVRDSADDARASAPVSVTVASAAGPLAVGPLLARYPGTIARAFSIRPVATGAKGPLEWRIVGHLPDWARFDLASGEVYGTPDVAGPTEGLSVTVTDGVAFAASKPFAIDVAPAQPLEISHPGLVTGVESSRLDGPSPTVSGSTGGNAFSLAMGDIPPGLSLSGSTGSLSGTPSTPGTYGGLSLTVRDSSGAVATSNPFTVSIKPAANDVSASMESMAGEVGERMAGTPASSGLVAPLSWVRSAGTLPDWASVDPATGTVQGVAQAVGAWRGIALDVSDSKGRTLRTAPFDITVALAPSLTVTMADIGGTVTQSLKGSPRAASAKGGLTWKLVGGRLPDGFALDPSTGEISGKSNLASEASDLVLRATDASGSTADTRAFALRVSRPVLSATLAGSPFKMTARSPGALPAPSASGSVGALTWSSSGALPTGVEIAPATGILSGTPATPGSHPGIVVTASDAFDGATASSLPFAIEVERPALTVSNGTGPYVAHAGSPLATLAPSATGLLGALTWQATGTMPDGMGVDTATGIVSGVPTAPGTYQDLRPVARDGFDGTSKPGSAITLRILGKPVASMASRQMRTAAPFTAAPTATEVHPPLRWALVQGTRPAWLAVDEPTGTLTGTPPAPGSWDGFVLRVTDALGASGDTAPFSLVATDAAPAGLSAVIAQTSYAARVTKPFATLAPLVGNATGSVSWTPASGSVPGWGTVATDTGILSGTPDAPGISSLTLRATQADGTSADTGLVTVTVTPAPSVAVADTYAVRVGAPLLAVPAVSDAVGAQAWVRTAGTLPGWASLDPATGRVTGTPDAVATFPGIVLRVTDADGVSGQGGPFSVTASPGIAIAGLPPARTLRAGTAVTDIAPSVTNALGAVAWSASGLPAGLTIEPGTGAITGKPAATGEYPVTVTAVDGADKATATGRIALTVIPALGLTGPGPVAGHSNVALASKAPGVSGQRGTLAWSLAAGALPDWLTLDPDLGMLRGTPPSPASVTGIVLRARDSFDQATASTEPFSVEVLGPLGVTDMATNYTARVQFAFVSTPPTLRNAVGAVRWAWGPTATQPSWLSLDPATGVMTGTPGPKVQTPNLTLVGTDASGLSASSIPFQMNVLEEPAVILAETSATTRVGGTVSLKPQATGMSGVGTWSVAGLTGTMPGGLSVDPGTGAFGGTVTSAGKATFTLRVSDGADGHQADSGTITVEANPAIEVAGLAPAYRGHAGARLETATPQARNAVGGVTWTASVPAPAGMTLTPNGQFAGTPTAGMARTTVTLTATDAYDGATGKGTFDLEVVPAIAATAKGDLKLRSGADAGLASLAPSATDAFSPGDVRWMLAAGSLQTGLSVDPATGRIVGSAPQVAALSEAPGIRLRATDVDGTQALTEPFAVLVAPTLGIGGVAAQQSATETLAFSLAPAPAGLVGAAGWTVTGLPSGLSVDGSTGAVSGQPSPGTGRVAAYVSRLVLRDAWDGTTVPAQFDLTVTPADPSPDAFSFQSVANATGGAAVTSQTVALTGMTVPGPLEVSAGGAYPVRLSVDGGAATTSYPGTVPANARLALSLDAAPGTDGGTRTATVKVGGVTATWQVTTNDTTPQAVTLVDATDVAAGSLVVSNTAPVTGITAPAPVSVSGEGNPQVSIAGGPWVTSGTVGNLQSVQVRLTAADTENGTFRSASLNIGGVVSGWNVSTRDTSPNPYTVAALDAQPLATLVAGAPVTVTGITSAAPVSVSGEGTPMVRVGGASGAWGTTASILDGQTFELRMTTAGTEATTRNALVTVGGVSKGWSVRTGVATPAPFAFAAVANAAVSSPVSSAPVTLSGASLPGSLTVTAGGGYAVRLGINGAPPSATIPATVPANATLVLSLDTPRSPDGTVRTATVNVNGVSATWSVTALDTVPDAYAFTSVQGQPMNAVVTSDAPVISGITAPASVTLTGTGSPEVSVNGGPWTSSTTTISSGQTLAVRLTSAGSALVDRTATVSAGGVIASFTVRTMGTDTSPDPFTVVDVGGTEPTATVVSGIVTPTGFDAPVTLSVTAAAGTPQVSVNGGAWTSSATFYPAQNFRVRVASGTFGQSRDVAVSLGDRSDTWTVAARLQDSAPDAFAFPNQTGQPGTTVVTSASVTPAGYLDAAAVSVSGAGAQVSVNGGPWGASGTVSPGQPIQVRLTTGIPDGVTSQATVTVGGVASTWSVTTLDSMPDARTFPTVTDVPPSTLDYLASVPRGVLLTGFTSPAYYDFCSVETYVRYVGVSDWYCNGYIQPGETFGLVAYGGSQVDANVTRTFTIGGRQFQINLKTLAEDINPWFFNFDSVSGATPGAVYISNGVSPSDFYSPSPVALQAGNATFDIDGSGTFVTSGTVRPGQKIRMRMAAPAAGGEACAQISVGYAFGFPWCIYSQAPDAVPDMVALATNTAPPSVYTNSQAAPAAWGWGSQLTGFNTATTVTIEGTINGSPWPHVYIAMQNQDGNLWAPGPARINPKQGFVPVLYTGPNPGDRVTMTLKANGTPFMTWAVVTEGTLDTTPDAFAFQNLTGQSGNAPVESQSIVPQGFSNPTAVTVTGPGAAVSIGGGAWVTSGTLAPGQTLRLRLTTGPANGGTTSATVTVGGVSATWSVTTSNLTPAAFSFPAVTGADPSVFVASGTVTVSGLGTQATASVTGGQVTVNGGGLATSATVRNGDVLQLFATTGSTYGTAQNVTLTVGAGSATWSITTRARDTTPGAFAIPELRDQATDSVATSAAVTPTAYLDAAPVSVSGEGTPEISVDGGAWGTSGTITPGQTFRVRLRSAAASGTARTATVTVGGVGASFVVTTR